MAFRSGGLASRLAVGSAPLQRRIANRTLAEDFDSSVKTYSRLELLAQWRLSRGGDEQKVLQRRNDAFQLSIPDQALRDADVVIGVDTASAILAERCKALNRPFVLDQTIGHPDAKQAMHDDMQTAFPEWREGFEKRRSEVRAAEIKEQILATAIVTASSFAKETLVRNGIPADKVHVIPYGVDTQRFARSGGDESRPFRFAYVGLLTARKGIPLLVKAWERLTHPGAELWLIGKGSPKAKTLLPPLPGLRHIDAVPHDDVPRLLSQCDSFVFPSFFEGFGLVLLEAMACGLPVITTTSTAGPDIITRDHDGWVLEPGNLDRLVGAMEFCLKNRNRIAEMGSNARRKAEQFSWNAYGERWSKILPTISGPT
jgi:glycosyltransferase involved in cell wall biosynthesis